MRAGKEDSYADWYRRLEKAVSLEDKQSTFLKISQESRPEGFWEDLRTEVPGVIIDRFETIISDIPGWGPAILFCAHMAPYIAKELGELKDQRESTYLAEFGRDLRERVSLEPHEQTLAHLRKLLKKVRTILEVFLTDDAPPLVSELYARKPEIREGFQRYLQTLREVEPKDIWVLQQIKSGTLVSRQKKLSYALERLRQLKLIEPPLDPDTALPTDVKVPTVTPFGDELLRVLSLWGDWRKS